MDKDQALVNRGGRMRQFSLLIVILATLFIASLNGTRADTNRGLTIVPATNSLVIGPIHFVEIFFVAGQNSERRWPRVGEELIVKAEIRNIGPVAIYYFPTLCDSSLSAVFDPSYVRVESGRLRCLAASILTALNPGEGTTVSAPESGTAYVAIRSGSTTITAIFSYNTDASLDPCTQAEARSTIPLTVEVGPTSLPVPGLPIESVVLGFVLALGILLYRRRIKTS
jgi:hypothetical protein